VATAYETALEKIKNGLKPEVAAAELVALMTLDEKVHCLDGASLIMWQLHMKLHLKKPKTA